MNLQTLIPLIPTFLLTDFLRYIIPAGGLLVFLIVARKYVQKRKIQDRTIRTQQYIREFLYSMSTVVIFSANGMFLFWMAKRGYTRIYEDVSEYGWLYFGFSLVLMVLLHDTYFYWTHRLMHTKFFFGLFHRIHHLSRTPGPLAAYAFAPPEAFVEAGIYHLIVFTIPVHPLALAIFLIWMIVRNVIGHTGFEFYPHWFVESPLTRWITTAVHHDMHHDHFNGNYGLYFRFWDKWMGTENPDYISAFKRITSSSSEGGKS